MAYSCADSVSVLGSSDGITAEALTDAVSQLRREVDRVKERLQSTTTKKEAAHPHRYEADRRARRMELEELNFTPPPRYRVEPPCPQSTTLSARLAQAPLLGSTANTRERANHPNPNDRLDLPIARPGSPQRTQHIYDACVPSLSIPSLTSRERKRIFTDRTNVPYQVVQLTHCKEPIYRSEGGSRGTPPTMRRTWYRDCDEHYKASIQRTTRERSFISPHHHNAERTSTSPFHGWTRPIDENVNMGMRYCREDSSPARAPCATKLRRDEDEDAKQHTQKRDVSATSCTRGRHSETGRMRRRTPSANQRLGSPDKRRVRSANYRTRWDRLAQPKVAHDHDRPAKRRLSRDRYPTTYRATASRSPRQRSSSARNQRNREHRVCKEGSAPKTAPLWPAAYGGPSQLKSVTSGFSAHTGRALRGCIKAVSRDATSNKGSHFLGLDSGLPAHTGRASRCAARSEFNDLWKAVHTLRADYNTLLCKLAQ